MCLSQVITGIWGMNLWSGHKFDLDGPRTKTPAFAPPDFPTAAYDDDASLGVSWIFLWNSFGITGATVLLIGFAFLVARSMGLCRIRVSQ